MKDFSKTSKPLTDLLKKDNFVWKEEARYDFETIKHALIFAHVLSLPNFKKLFTIETDTSGRGIGVTLMHDQHHIAYISKALGIHFTMVAQFRYKGSCWLECYRKSS